VIKTTVKAPLKVAAAVARGAAAGLVALGLVLGASGCASTTPAATGGMAGGAGSGAPVELSVSAASSLKGVLTASAAAFEKANNAKLVFNFGASGLLVRQIEGGAPADVFLSASRAAVTTLAAEGLASAEDSATFAGNALVILVPKGNPAGLRGPSDLARAGKLTTGDPAVAPQGQKAVEWLTGLGMWGALRPQFVFASNAAQTVDYVARGEVDAGIAFASDAHGRTDVGIAYTVPDGEIKPIAYVAAPLTATRQAALATAYLEFLLSSRTQADFVDAGFKPAPAK
jgi:molybdate transport system substrate-binding protein